MPLRLGGRMLIGLACFAMQPAICHADTYDDDHGEFGMDGPVAQRADALFSDAVASRRLGDMGRVTTDLDQWFGLKQKLAARGSIDAAIVVCAIYRDGKTHYMIDNFDLPKYQLPPSRAARECRALHVPVSQ